MAKSKQKRAPPQKKDESIQQTIKKQPAASSPPKKVEPVQPTPPKTPVLEVAVDGTGRGARQKVRIFFFVY